MAGCRLWQCCTSTVSCCKRGGLLQASAVKHKSSTGYVPHAGCSPGCRTWSDKHSITLCIVADAGNSMADRQAPSIEQSCYGVASDTVYKCYTCASNDRLLRCQCRLLRSGPRSTRSCPRAHSGSAAPKQSTSRPRRCMPITRIHIMGHVPQQRTMLLPLGTSVTCSWLPLAACVLAVYEGATGSRFRTIACFTPYA